MKRHFAAILAIVLIFSCTACGSKRVTGISDRAYELGLSALETADDYISGKIDATTAENNLERASILIDDDGSDGENNILVSSAITLLQISISNKRNGTGTMSSVEEHRERLADLLGK